MICVNHKKNPKLLETFNNDPYSDITICTATTQLNLILGYLSIDSEYFERVAVDTKQINLSHLPEASTIRVLRALYGEELYTFNVKELEELYGVIDFLEIKEYKNNIHEYIKSHEELMDSLELLELCFKNNVLVEEMKEHHFSMNLEMLSCSKNYLKLNKVTEGTLNPLLLSFVALKGTDADPIVNSILQNYFGRNDIKPNVYFTKPELEPLQIVWEKYHHSINYLISTQQKIRQSQIFMNSMGTGNSSMPSYGLHNGLDETRKSLILTGGGFSLSSTNISNELIEKDEIIKKLENELELKNEIVARLKAEISNARREAKKSVQQMVDSDEGEQSMLEEVKKSKKERDSLLSNEYDVSLIEPAFDQARKLDQNKQVKTMNRLNSRTKKIFN